jgi:hypothetical protein
LCAATGLVVSVVPGCETTAKTANTTSSSPPAPGPGSAEPRARLAARAASAKDRSFTAAYSLSPPDRRVRTITVTVAADRSWRIELGGAVSGTDVTLVGVANGQYQCLSSGAKGRECVLVAGPGSGLPASVDPGVQHPFTDWLDLLTDPAVAITVGRAANPADSPGDCYSVEATTVTLAPAIESSVFCYTDEGTLTAVRADFGLLTISGQPTAGPGTIELPGPVMARSPLPIVTATETARSSPGAQGDPDRRR